MSDYRRLPAHVAGLIGPPRLALLSYQQAAASLVDKFSVAAASKKLPDASTLNGKILDFALAFLRDCHARAIPMYVHTGFRSEADQLAAYNGGFSRAKPGHSPHQYGLAVDIVHETRAWNLNPREWDVLGLIGKEVARKRKLSISWGGDWSSPYDPAHWQLSDWRVHAHP